MAFPSQRPPGVIGVAVRVFLITLLLTLLSFAVSLFAGIVGSLVVGLARGRSPNLTVAYRSVAFPVAAGVCVVVFVLALVTEIRRYREARMLARIERTS
jgi:zinc transporter ZupT